MNPKTIISLLAIAGALTWRAGAQTNDIRLDVLRTLDGETFTNARVERGNAVFAVVTFDGGGKKIPFTNLPPDVQTQLGFDPAKAQDEVDRQARRKQEAQDALQAQIKARQEAEKDRLFRIVDDKVFPVSDFQYMHGRVLQVLSNGVLLILYKASALHLYAAPVHGNLNIGGMADGPSLYFQDELSDKTVFVKCPIRGMTDGRDWRGLCKPNGTFSYTSIDGSQRVVEKLDTGVSSVTRSDAVLQPDDVPVNRPARPRTSRSPAPASPPRF